MAEIETLNCLTRLDIPVARVIDGLHDANLTYVLALGWDNEGDLYVASSGTDMREALWIMEKVKSQMLAGEHA